MYYQSKWDAPSLEIKVGISSEATTEFFINPGFVEMAEFLKKPKSQDANTHPSYESHLTLVVASGRRLEFSGETAEHLWTELKGFGILVKNSQPRAGDDGEPSNVLAPFDEGGAAAQPLS